MTLCDFSGEIYDRKTNSGNADHLKKSHGQTCSSPVIYYGHTIFLNNVVCPVTREEDTTMYLLLAMDSKNANLLPGLSHPAKILDLNFDISTFRLMNWTYDSDKTIYYGFNFDPNVDAFDIASFHSVETSLKGPRMQVPPPVPQNRSSQEDWLHFQAHLSYSKILIDTTGDYFLRFIMVPNDLQSMLSGETNTEIPKRAVMEIYNRDFEYLGEWALQRQYAFKNSFFADGRLWIRKIWKPKMNYVFKFLNSNTHSTSFELKYIMLSMIFCLVACQHSDDAITDKCNIKQHEYEISIPTTTSVGYRIMDTDVRSGVLVGYQYRQHALDWIDLDNGAFLKHQELSRSGPDLIEQVLSLTLAGLDTIFLLTTHSIIIMNGEGKILVKKRTNRKDAQIDGLDFTKFRIWCAPEHNIPLYYSKGKNLLYIGVKLYKYI